MRRCSAIAVAVAVASCAKTVTDPAPPPPPIPPPPLPLYDIAALTAPGDDVWLVASDGSNPRQLTEYGRDSDVHWTPDGQLVYFTRLVPESHFEVFSMEPDGSSPTNLSQHHMSALLRDVHPVAGILMLGQSAEPQTIWSMKLDGSDKTQLTQPLVGENDFQPAWSPDGSEFAFVRSQPPASDLWIANADGSNQRLLQSSLEGVYGFDWHPGGGLLVASYRTGSSAQVHLVPVDGSAATPLTSEGTNTHPVWSPSGGQIAYIEGGSRHVMVMNADGSGKTQIGNGAFPQWSPDETRIAFCEGNSRSSTRGAVVIRLDTGESKMTFENGRICLNQIAWRPR